MALSKLVLSLDLGGPRRLQIHEDNEKFLLKILLLRSVHSSHHCAGNILSVWLVTLRNTITYRWLVKRHTICSTSVVRDMFRLIASFILWTFVVGTKIRGLERRWSWRVIIFQLGEVKEGYRRSGRRDSCDASSITICWHDSQIDEMFCDECSPFHKVEDIDDVRAGNWRSTQTPALVTMPSTSHNVGRCLGWIRFCPLLNSSLSDLVFRFELI